ALQNPELALVKSAAPATYDAAGDVIAYTYTLTNSGNVTLMGPFTVTDDKAATSRADVPGDPDVLAPGAQITFTAAYTITQADVDAGSVTNVAQGFGVFDGEPVASNQDDETVTALASPALALVKSAVPATYDAAGQTITYSYRLTNSGNVTLMGPFTVADDKAATAPVGMAPMALAPGAWIDFTAAYTITQADVDTGYVTNTARGHGHFGEDDVYSNYDDETVRALQNPELALVKSAAPATYDAAGDVIAYTYTLTNSGNVTLMGPFTVTDDKAATSRADVPGDPDVLAPGAQITFTAAYTITQADVDAGSVTNVAQGFGVFDGEPVASNQDDETVTALQAPAIEIIKLTNGTDGAYILMGGPITWSYQVTNTGNVTLSSVVVTDDDLGLIGNIEMLAPGASETLYALGVATEGFYENVGTATGQPPVGDNVTDSDDSSYFGGSPAISVEKSVDSDLVIEGEEVTYTFMVRNTGNTTLSNVLVEDDHLGVIATIPSLAPGALQVFTRTVAIFEPTTNIVTATGVDELGNEVSDQDVAFVDIDEFLGFPPDLSVKKRGDMTLAKPGDTITYTLTVGNEGGDPAYDYTVTDTFNAKYLTVVDAAGGAVAGNSITWEFDGPLAFGETQTIVYKLKVADTMPVGISVLDNVAVVSHPEDDFAENDRASWSVRVKVDAEDEPFLPFTGGDALLLAAFAGVAASVGAGLRRRSRRVA
ncbi:MAG: DUF11 domain-containing protein, partial [Clostridiales bacterium]|nr:DUF11 domain-containing protein [Clostridiales bacterium]